MGIERFWSPVNINLFHWLASVLARHLCISIRLFQRGSKDLPSQDIWNLLLVEVINISSFSHVGQFNVTINRWNLAFERKFVGKMISRLGIQLTILVYFILSFWVISQHRHLLNDLLTVENIVRTFILRSFVLNSVNFTFA